MDQTGLNSLYQQYFGRDADPSGLATFGNQDQGAVTSALQNSQEFQNLHPEGALSFLSANAGKTANLAGWNNDPLQNEYNFNSDAYLAANPDAANPALWQASPYEHYLEANRIGDKRQGIFDKNPATAMDPSKWETRSYNLDPNDPESGVGNYYVDPRTGNAYTYSRSTDPDNPEGGGTIDPTSIKALAGGAALNDPLLQAAGLNYDPNKAQELYNKKANDPHSFYSTIGDKISNDYFGAWSANMGNEAQFKQQLEPLKTADPAAYYKALIDAKAKEVGWQYGQNRQDRADVHTAELKQLLPDAIKAGLKPTDLNNLINKNVNDASRQNQQRIANLDSGGMFGDAIPALTMMAAMVIAPELAPLMAAELGAVGGAAATGAIIGGGSGAINAAAGNRNIGEGLLKGAAIGGVGGAVSGGINSAFNASDFGASGMSEGLTNGGVTGNIYDDAGNLISSGNPAPSAANWGNAFGGTNGIDGDPNGVYTNNSPSSNFGTKLASNLGSKLATTGLSSILASSAGGSGLSSLGSGGSNSQNLINSGLASLGASNALKSPMQAVKDQYLKGAEVYNKDPHVIEQLRQLDPRILAALGIKLNAESPSLPAASESMSQYDLPTAAEGGSQSDILERFQNQRQRNRSGALMNSGLKLISGQKEGGKQHSTHHREHVPEFITGATGHYVKGKGDGQSDDIPAMLADGEYVFDADTVAALGNGSSDAGAKLLDHFRESLREHKRSAASNKIPPKASPLAYMKEALKRHSKG